MSAREMTTLPPLRQCSTCETVESEEDIYLCPACGDTACTDCAHDDHIKPWGFICSMPGGTHSQNVHVHIGRYKYTLGFDCTDHGVEMCVIRHDGDSYTAVADARWDERIQGAKPTNRQDDGGL